MPRGHSALRGPRSGWAGLMQAIVESVERHPPTDDGGADPDHCPRCREAYHEHRKEGRRPPAEWDGWEAAFQRHDGWDV